MIKFYCDACNQVIEAPPELRTRSVTCPNCQHAFIPSRFLTVPLTVGERVKLTAHKFSLVALALAVGGVLGFIANASSGTLFGGFTWLGWCLGLAFVVYVGAQIIHIRGNTEKD
jgi:hypothetical protein